MGHSSASSPQVTRKTSGGIASRSSRSNSDEVRGPKLSMVAWARQGNRGNGKVMSVVPIREGISSRRTSTTLDLAVPTLAACTLRLCRAIPRSNVPCGSGCLLQMAGGQGSLDDYGLEDSQRVARMVRCTRCSRAPRDG